VLLVFLVVTAAAVVGGRRPALPGAVAGAVLLNWFFTPPFGAPTVEDPTQLVVLGGYLAVRGPELFAADLRVLRSFADAAANALQGRRLASRAAEAVHLEAADRMRTALLAGVGHDLRTPLAA
jgi:two-component system sensor histidine kinase KdpD